MSTFRPQRSSEVSISFAPDDTLSEWLFEVKMFAYTE